MGMDALIDGFWDSLFGGDIDSSGMQRYSLASGIVFGTNPPYTLSDFLAMYPHFFGPESAITATLDGTSATITALNSTQNLKPGQLVTGNGIPNGTLIVSVNATAKTAVLSNVTTASGTTEQLTVYTSPKLPTLVMQTYLNLAAASLMQEQYFDAWQIQMADYIGHFCTLYIRRVTSADASAARVAVAGLERGITVSKSAGGVSSSMQLASGLEDWASWTKTEYGTDCATRAKSIGSAAIWVG